MGIIVPTSTAELQLLFVPLVAEERSNEIVSFGVHLSARINFARGVLPGKAVVGFRRIGSRVRGE